MANMHIQNIHGHIPSLMAHEQKVNGYGSMVLGTILTVQVTWLLMDGMVLHGMGNITNIILMLMATT